jgi:hypothetical protein
VESTSPRVDLNPMFNQREYDGNVVNLGIIRGTVIQRQCNLVQDPMRSNRMRET